jgi:transaldolase
MKLFVDTAKLEEIKETLNRGFVRGITTNPSLLAKEPKTAFEEHIKKIIRIIEEFQNGIHLSVEVFSKKPEEILAQARQFRDTFKYPYLSIKIQIGWDELEAIHKLRKEGFSINCTCCMTTHQAIMAAAAGAQYISLFVGRIRDGGFDQKFKEERLASYRKNALNSKDFDPWHIIKTTRKQLNEFYNDVQIIAGSIRSADDVKMAGVSGAHIVTVQPKFFPDMISHFKTDEVVQEFLDNFKNWLK